MTDDVRADVRSNETGQKSGRDIKSGARELARIVKTIDFDKLGFSHAVIRNYAEGYARAVTSRGTNLTQADSEMMIASEFKLLYGKSPEDYAKQGHLSRQAAAKIQETSNKPQKGEKSIIRRYGSRRNRDKDLDRGR